MYGTTSGTYSLSATNQVRTGTLSVTILQLQLKFDSMTPVPGLPNTEFAVQVGIYDNTGTTLLSGRGSFTITIALDLTGTITGTLSGTSSTGIITFSSLMVTTYDTYTLKAQSTDMIDGVSSSFTIVPLALTTITCSTVISKTAYFSFDVSLTLKDQSLGLWTTSTSIDVTGSSTIGGTTTLTVTTGTDTFYMYGTVSGTLVITLKSGAITGTCSVEILKLSLVIYSITPTVFFN